MDQKAAYNARHLVETALASADKAAAKAEREVSQLVLDGLDAAEKAGVHPSLLGPTFTYVGKAQKAVSDLIAALGGIHYHLHKVAERPELQPPDDGPVPQGGSGGGKGDPPPPEG